MLVTRSGVDASVPVSKNGVVGFGNVDDDDDLDNFSTLEVVFDINDNADVNINVSVVRSCVTDANSEVYSEAVFSSNTCSFDQTTNYE
eukprot:Awhi_evm1s5713